MRPHRHTRSSAILSEQTAAGVKSEISFSEWGEQLSLAAPKGAAPASSITPASSTT